MNDTQAAEMFQVLAHADRLCVIRALVAAGPSGLAAGEIAALIGASPSRTSFHLNALAGIGFLRRERQAQSLRYSADFARMADLLAYFMQDCCKNAPELTSCCR